MRTNIPEWRNVDAALFQNEIAPLNRPAVLRGVAAHWPIVRAAAVGPKAARDHLMRFDQGKPFDTLRGPPAIKGRFFYGDTVTQFNFERRREALAAVTQDILDLADEAEPPSVFVQSTAIKDHLSGFERENVLEVLPPTVAPRIWIGNAVTIQTHFDPLYNIAVVAAGRRRFTLFPPSQLANLYVGPLDITPAGPPVSMVSLYEPDFARYPRFREALAQAQSAELEPGDAVYIPFFWWHHVQSLATFNMLVNYWWLDAPAHATSPFEALFHAVWALRDLPEAQRDVWRGVFDHYVFKADGEPMAHLPEGQQGVVMGPPSAERARQIRHLLLRQLNRGG